MYCLPAVVYIVLQLTGIVYMVVSGQSGMVLILFQLLFLMAFSWFIDFLCRRGYTIASWFIVLLPFIFMFSLVAGAIAASRLDKNLGAASVSAPAGK